MNKYEIAQRASALPARFAERVPPPTLESIQLMEEGGEYEDLTIELAASLAADNAPVTAAERDELLELLEAMDMPTDPIGKLNVQG
ncbi:MAG: hypothetical protein M3Z75_02245 [Actinomycetota bacterium]|nr:hypothetical protein [Actinomycetota bacterium]